MLEIRRLQISEVPELARVARQVFLDTFLGQNNPADVIDYADGFLNSDVFTAELQKPTHFTYGVFWQKELAGYIQMVINKNEVYEGIELELKRFYLLSKFHGQGLAKEMMQVCENQARELGYKAFWLGVWEKNFRAQKFYQKSGFQKIASHPFVMGQETQTDFIFAKYLTNQSQK